MNKDNLIALRLIDTEEAHQAYHISCVSRPAIKNCLRKGYRSGDSGSMLNKLIHRASVSAGESLFPTSIPLLC